MKQINTLKRNVKSIDPYFFLFRKANQFNSNEKDKRLTMYPTSARLYANVLYRLSRIVHMAKPNSIKPSMTRMITAILQVNRNIVLLICRLINAEKTWLSIFERKKMKCQLNSLLIS